MSQPRPRCTPGPGPAEPRAGRRLLVTGGAGFIGSHLVEALLARGERVVVLDDLSTGLERNLEGLARSEALRVVRGSVLDARTVERLVGEVDGVLHLAAAVGVRLVLERPVRTMRVNAEGTRVVLAAAARHGRRCLIASSSEVYGRSTQLPFHEEAPLLLGATSEPRWAYACSKAMGEWTAFGHAAQDGLAVTAVRYFNVVGPRQRGRYGMVLPNFVRQALAGAPLTVFGDGRQTRCFLDVRDAVRATLELFDAPAGDERVFNVGSRDEVAIGELAERVRARLGGDSPIVHMPYREAYGLAMTDLMRRVPDTGRLERRIAFAPAFGLEDSIDAVARFEAGAGRRGAPAAQ